MRIINILLCLSFSSLWAQDYPQDYFRSPLGIELISSGTFGELRGNHFHSGLDIKTQGRVGLPVYAVAPAYVSRIKVSPYGFGKALYLRHPNGYTSVYAHLEKFSPEIEAFVAKEMKRLRKNEVDLFPSSKDFVLQRGEEIAKSGNSGGSGGPHLHFEIRDTRTEKIINPLLFGFKVSDTRFPELKDLQAYFFNNAYSTGQKEYSLVGGKGGKYYLSGDGKVIAEGPVSFGIYAIDRQDRANNRNGVYSLKLFVGERLHYHYQVETFAFAETRYINAHIDYALKACCKKTLHRLFQLPGNQLSIYPKGKKVDHLSFDRDTLVDIRIEAADAAGNISRLNFKLDYKHRPGLQEEEQQGMMASTETFTRLPTDWPKLREVDWTKPVKIKDIKHRLNIPAKAFYQDLILEREQKPACKSCLSQILHLGTTEVPVHRYYDLALKLDYMPSNLDPSKLFIASLRDGRYADNEGGTYADGWVHTRTRQLGEFSIMVDSLSPKISAINFKSGSSLSTNSVAKIRVRDNLTGIKQYNAWVDDQWVPVYFDAKTAQLLLELKYWPAPKKAKQELMLKVVDGRGNQSREIWTIIRG